MKWKRKREGRTADSPWCRITYHVSRHDDHQSIYESRTPDGDDRGNRCWRGHRSRECARQRLIYRVLLGVFAAAAARAPTSFDKSGTYPRVSIFRLCFYLGLNCALIFADTDKMIFFLYKVRFVRKNDSFSISQIRKNS